MWLCTDETAVEIHRFMHYTLYGLQTTTRERGRGFYVMDKCY